MTWKLCRGLPSLRKKSLVAGLRSVFLALRRAREDFRVIEYSIQADHLHLIVEADDERALSRGMNALGTRIAREINQRCRRRGKVFRERFHLRVLRSPREVKNAIGYVLCNFRKHEKCARAAIDWASSAPLFRAWSRVIPESWRAPPSAEAEVSSPRTWLLSVGWLRHHGEIDPSHVPS